MKKTRRCLLPEALCERTDPPHRKGTGLGPQDFSQKQIWYERAMCNPLMFQPIQNQPDRKPRLPGKFRSIRGKSRLVRFM